MMKTKEKLDVNVTNIFLFFFLSLLINVNGLFQNRNTKTTKIKLPASADM